MNPSNLDSRSSTDLTKSSVRDAKQVQAVKNSFRLTADSYLVFVNPDSFTSRKRFPEFSVTYARLRLKDLVEVQFESATDKRADEGIYCWALSKRPIAYQLALFCKPSRSVVLETAFRQSRKELVCPSSGVKFESSDIIKLHRGGPIYY